MQLVGHMLRSCMAWHRQLFTSQLTEFSIQQYSLPQVVGDCVFLACYCRPGLPCPGLDCMQ